MGKVLARFIDVHWDATWALAAWAVEALLLWWMRGDVVGWALAATVTASAWSLAWTARLWKQSESRPDWLVVILVGNVVILGVVVGLAYEASGLDPTSLFWYVPLLVVIAQFSIPIAVAPNT